MSRDQLKKDRVALGISQSRLARLAHLPRFKIVFFELGERPLSEEDQACVRAVLQAEAGRLVSAAAEIGRELATIP